MGSTFSGFNEGSNTATNAFNDTPNHKDEVSEILNEEDESGAGLNAQIKAVKSPVRRTLQKARSDMKTWRKSISVEKK